ncbi:putative membrane protein [Delphinella strobiligena]|nr:putative membrane protein [Delphinella strobiligena]
MAFFEFTHPTSYRLASAALNGGQHIKRYAEMATEMPVLRDTAVVGLMNNHESHPDFGHLTLLVFEAVLEVVCVALPGYIVARQGMLNADAQKMLANMNVQIFTPCLVFTKLASQLNADKLADLAVIPFIFVVQTFISWLCARLVSKAFRFGKRQTNFVVAMGVFGNSNSLPISLVLSLSKTLKGLHWDQVPGDNDNEVAARGILYLLIFQQLGQLVRWTWGYNVLLAPPPDANKLTSGENGEERDSLIEEGRYRDEPEEDSVDAAKKRSTSSEYYASPTNSLSSSSTAAENANRPLNGEVLPTPANGNIVGAGPGNLAGNANARHRSEGHITTFPTYDSTASSQRSDEGGIKGASYRTTRAISSFYSRVASAISGFFSRLFGRLPAGAQKFLSSVWSKLSRFVLGVWAFMNPPLWAMLFALIVASVPQLQALFFQEGSFVKNSVTRAISQSGGVAVPLILVVLGANLARNTLPADQLADQTPEGKKEERNLLIASLVSRMLLPTLLMAPMLALIAKFVPVSILDDPIFVIVCFLLTGAPSALQLAQICQINNVYMGAMSRLLFQSYVVWILPSTLILVMLALEVVEWAAGS